jgi:hypothetical protein
MSESGSHKAHPDLWNTWTANLLNWTPWTLGILDGEDQTRHKSFPPFPPGTYLPPNKNVNFFFPGTGGKNSTAFPWCINGQEVAQKALHVYAVPPGLVGGAAWLVSVFQYYKDNEVYYIRHGDSFDKRISCGEGPSSSVDLTFTVVPGASTANGPTAQNIAVAAQAINVDVVVTKDSAAP